MMRSFVAAALTVLCLLGTVVEAPAITYRYEVANGGVSSILTAGQATFLNQQGGSGLQAGDMIAEINFTRVTGAAGDTLTADDILSDVLIGRNNVLGLFNGSNPFADVSFFQGTHFARFDGFSLEEEARRSRLEQTLYIAFRGFALLWEDRRAQLLGLRASEEVFAVPAVPLPESRGLALSVLGLLVAAGLRRRKRP